jgi:hypothetical protein
LFKSQYWYTILEQIFIPVLRSPSTGDPLNISLYIRLFLGPLWLWSYGSWFYNYLGYAISAYHHWYCEFESWSGRGVLDTTLCDKVCQWLAKGQWFSSGPLVSSTNKTDHHDITEILLKVALNTINLLFLHMCKQNM